MLWRRDQQTLGPWRTANQGPQISPWPKRWNRCTKGEYKWWWRENGKGKKGTRKRTLRVDNYGGSMSTIQSFTPLEVPSCGCHSTFLSSSVGGEHHTRCRLQLHLCFAVRWGLKVKGHLVCFGTFGNAGANPYLWNPVMSSHEDQSKAWFWRGSIGRVCLQNHEKSHVVNNFHYVARIKDRRCWWLLLGLQMQNVKKYKIFCDSFVEAVSPVPMLTWSRTSNPRSHFHLLPYIPHITSLLWNAMGNSWVSCPSNIKDQLNQCGVSYPFSPLVSTVTAALRAIP